MMSLASKGQKVQDIALLLAQRGYRGENAFGETQPPVTLRAKTAFAPEDAAAQGAFSRINGGFDAFMFHKRPQSRRNLENVGASLGSFGMLMKVPRPHCVNIGWDTSDSEFSVEFMGEEEQYDDTKTNRQTQPQWPWRQRPTRPGSITAEQASEPANIYGGVQVMGVGRSREMPGAARRNWPVAASGRIILIGVLGAKGRKPTLSLNQIAVVAV